MHIHGSPNTSIMSLRGRLTLVIRVRAEPLVHRSLKPHEKRGAHANPKIPNTTVSDISVFGVLSVALRTEYHFLPTSAADILSVDRVVFYRALQCSPR